MKGADSMAVFRVEKNQNYTVMSNHHLRNPDLSLKSKGLLSQMLSLPEEWDYTLKGLSKINREGIDAIREAVRELERAGYVTRTRIRNEKGQLGAADYVIHEFPIPPKPDVFGEDYATGTPGGGEYTDYEIPPEALSDERFAAMIAEAEKYLGYPYVWGGSSPSTSFDCSGFVCWVINHSGVGSVGRTTAQGIFNYTTPIAPSEAKPGDIIFFTGTYDSGSAVSHVGIYVGNGMMIHCGNPISYASVNTPYWQSHFYSYGRLP